MKVFVISLELDEQRRAPLMSQLAGYRCFDVELSFGIDGAQLPIATRRSLTGDSAWTKNKGTIGCFVAHARTWQRIADGQADYGIVLEDDVETIDLPRFFDIRIPDDVDLLFINDRLALDRVDEQIGLVRMLDVLRRIDAGMSSIGGDGYCLSKLGAQKLITALDQDKYYGHVDGRLLRYATTESDLIALGGNSGIADVILNHHNPARPPALGLLSARCLSAPLVKHRGMTSIRAAYDLEGDNAEPQPDARKASYAVVPAFAKQTPRSSIPIRYWNRVRNAGDSLNPILIKYFSGSEPYFEYDPKKDHILGMGSVLDMATPSSYIWGSGLLHPDPGSLQLDGRKVRAVRGRHTQDIIRSICKIDRDIVLGDPGMLVGELPGIRGLRGRSSLRWKVALVPHYSMIDDIDIAAIARSPDTILLRPGLPPIEFLENIAQAECVISASLHGLVFAQALGAPYTWISHRRDDEWLFKYFDWFSNMTGGSPTPLSPSAGTASLVAAARLYEVSCDLQALKNCLPTIAGDRSFSGFDPLGGLRGYTPPTVLVKTKSQDSMSGLFDATIYSRSGDVASLQHALNDLGSKSPSLAPLILVFEERELRHLSYDDVARALELFDAIAPLHYIQFDNRDADGLENSTGLLETATYDVQTKFLSLGLSMHNPNEDRFWKGVLLLRHPLSFHFDAPGLALRRFTE